MLRFITLLALFGLSLGLPSSKIQPRLVNGVKVNIEDAPYQAALETDGNQICGGAIINEKFVLTSAQCVTGVSANSLKVRVGSENRLKGGQVVSASKVTVHPKNDVKNYDLAVVELQEKLTFNNQIKAIALPSADETVPAKVDGFVTGWGLNKQSDIGGKPSDVLLGNSLPIASKIACRAVYPDDFTETMFCAGGPIGGYGPCDGDWGGPLVVDGKLVGIASWGHGCGQPNFPSVYQSVAKSIDFIQEVIG